MRLSPGSSGRTILLVVLLLAACYFADWTDDYSSYSNAARYASFETANGPRRSVSGGSMFAASFTAALAARANTTAEKPGSTIDAVFGAPFGLPQSDADDTSSRATAGAFDPFASGTRSRGLGGSGSGSVLGFSNNSSFGQRSPGSGLGSAGSSGMSVMPIFGAPQ